MIKHWLAAAAITGMLLAGPVFAHAKLRSSIPAAGAELRTAPKTLTLNFGESVRLALLTLTADGKDIPLTLDRSAPPSPEVSVALPALNAGTYRVQWSALSVDDGHVSKGTFVFEIAAAR